jgi:RIO-like serine/threonine protein kinase
MIYVIEKLDYTLYDMLVNNLFKPIHIKKLIEILKKLQRTKYRHNDLHSDNIMFSKQKNRFFIIDWGIFELIPNCNDHTKKICYKYNSRNLNMLELVFFYASNKIKTSKNKKEWSVPIKEFLKLFGAK